MNTFEQKSVSSDELLASLEEKQQLIRDRTKSVAEGYTTGLYVYGDGGIAKSFTIEETLKSLGRAYCLTNSRISAKGLFELFEEHRDAVHVLDDVETLFSDRNAFGLLRSACWGLPGSNGIPERVITWQVSGKRQEVMFSGGVIAIGNRQMGQIPELSALKTRIASIHYAPTTDEIAALMKQIACRGHQHGEFLLAPDDCLEVASEILDSCQRMHRPLDLRLLINSFKDRLQWANGDCETHWKDMLASRMRERTLASGERHESRAGRKSKELEVAKRIADMPPQERLAAWKSETGKSLPALYRRLDDLKRIEWSEDNSQILSLQTT